tara:strand:- start:136 stop:831 length:696 start_codon:yes stop_codon:yes gene_type:complete
MEESQPTERQNTLWDIILQLYDEELNARMIGIRLNKPKSLINSCLYQHRGNMFISDTSEGWAPLWKLSKIAIDLHDQVHSPNNHSGNFEQYDSLFCRKCNNLLTEKFCTINDCDENPIPKNAEYIPPFVKGGDGENSISPMRFLEYSVGIGLESDKMRKDILQNIFCVEFWTPKNAGNKLYVDSWGPGGSELRRNKMISHLGGINVGSEAIHSQRREIDIQVLKSLECDGS